jgi:hypothetical protein
VWKNLEWKYRKAGEKTISRPVDRPIDARNNAGGNPAAINAFGAELNRRQEKLLAQLPEYRSRIEVSKRDVSMRDLAALTAKTNVEYGAFTKNGKRLVIRGNSIRVGINDDELLVLVKQGYRFSGHTHPTEGPGSLLPSSGDKGALGCMTNLWKDNVPRQQQ